MRVYEASISYNLVKLGENLTVNTPAKTVEYLESAFAVHPMLEAFWVILLDRKNRALGRVMISLGTLSNTLVHPREVFKPAFLASASAIIVAHNHPSGDPAPSAADLLVTRQQSTLTSVMHMADEIGKISGGFSNRDRFHIKVRKSDYLIKARLSEPRRIETAKG